MGSDTRVRLVRTVPERFDRFVLMVKVIISLLFGALLALLFAKFRGK